jgi:hypothetical protein
VLARGASVALSPRVDGDSQVDYTRSVGVDLLDDGMATTNTDYMDLTDFFGCSIKRRSDYLSRLSHTMLPWLVSGRTTTLVPSRR